MEAYHFDATEGVGKIAAVASQFVVAAAYDRRFCQSRFFDAQRAPLQSRLSERIAAGTPKAFAYRGG